MGESVRYVTNLAAALRDPDPNVRKAVSGALGAMGEDGAEVLAGMLNDKDSAVRTGACEAMGHIGPAAGAYCDFLGAALQRGDVFGGDPQVRHAAAHALARLGPQGKLVLSLALRDRDMAVRTDAAEGLSLMQMQEEEEKQRAMDEDSDDDI